VDQSSEQNHRVTRVRNSYNDIKRNQEVKVKNKENKMPRAKKTTTTKRPGRKTVRRNSSDRRKNISGNLRGSEDIFWTKVVNGFKKFFESPFK